MARLFAQINKVFTFNNQVLDNMFWTCGSGVTICSTYEVLMMWALANGQAPMLLMMAAPNHISIFCENESGMRPWLNKPSVRYGGEPGPPVADTDVLLAQVPRQSRFIVARCSAPDCIATSDNVAARFARAGRSTT